MEIATANLLQAIEREQAKRQMSARKFSKQVLGISHSYLSLLRAGKRHLTPNLAVLFMQKLPAVTPEVTYYIMRQGNDANNKKDGGEIINLDISPKPLKKMGVKIRG